MLFSAAAWPGIADRSIAVTFRAWKRAQARVGGQYRVGGLLIEVTRVGQVGIEDITGDDARRAGADVATLRAQLGNAHPVWRVDFVFVGADDRIARRQSTSPDEIAEVIASLARVDRNRAWTQATLRLIGRYPGIVSTTLARHAGQERAAFKLDVRKLKELGLTESLDIGYRLSPRGQALLRSLG